MKKASINMPKKFQETDRCLFKVTNTKNIGFFGK